MNIRLKINLFHSILAHLEQEFLIELIDICYLIPHNYYNATRDGHIFLETMKSWRANKTFVNDAVIFVKIGRWTNSVKDCSEK